MLTIHALTVCALSVHATVRTWTLRNLSIHMLAVQALTVLTLTVGYIDCAIPVHILTAFSFTVTSSSGHAHLSVLWLFTS